MSKKTALISLFIILGLALIFHFLIISSIIPYDQVWAGRLQSVEEMKRFESFSILLLLCMLFVFSIKYKLLSNQRANKVIHIFIWIFAGFFALNTIGNLFSKGTMELIFGTLFTLVSTILCFIVVRKEKAS